MRQIIRTVLLNVKIIMLIMILLVAFLDAEAKKLMNLPELTKNPKIAAWKNSIYILDGNTCKIHIYSKSKLKHLKSFGGKGGGPGEFISTPAAPIIHKGVIYIQGNSRVSLFSEEGRLKKVIKIPHMMTKVIPLDGNFLCQKINWNIKPRKDGSFFSTISLYNSSFREIKKIYDGVPSLTGMTPRSQNIVTNYYFWDCIKYSVTNDTIVIADTRKGFYFQLFSTSGNTLREIKIPFKKVTVTAEIKKNTISQYKRIGKKLFGNKVNNVKLKYKHEFPRSVPAIQSFTVSNDKIYAFPHCLNDKKIELIVIDLSGNILKNRRFTELDRDFLFLSPFCIDDGTLYYVNDNENEETWELHAVKIE